MTSMYQLAMHNSYELSDFNLERGCPEHYSDTEIPAAYLQQISPPVYLVLRMKELMSLLVARRKGAVGVVHNSVAP